MEKKRHRNVALLFKRYIYRIHRGIVRYATEAGWSLDCRLQNFLKLPDNWNGDGIISHHMGLESIVEIIKNQKVPTVDLGFKREEINLPNVYMDNKAIGEMAGEYLLSKGFKNIGYIRTVNPLGKSHSDEERYNALKKLILSQGNFFFSLRANSFLGKLKDLPKPIALMGENDAYTSDYIRMCLMEGYKIPLEIAFISVDNDPLFCDVAQVPMTSIDNALDDRGYRAAELLDRLMDGESVSEKSILIPPKRVVERESSNILAISHMPTSKALKHITGNFRNPNLSVMDAVKVSGMCRRRLEDNFMKHIGHSMPNEILRLRLDEAKRLLKETDLKIYEIADECGFSSAHHMIKTFRRKLGITPRAFRNQ